MSDLRPTERVCKYRGVSFAKQHGKHAVFVCWKGRQYHFSSYKSAEHAAYVRDAVWTRLGRDPRFLNFAPGSAPPEACGGFVRSALARADRMIGSEPAVGDAQSTTEEEEEEAKEVPGSFVLFCLLEAAKRVQEEEEERCGAFFHKATLETVHLLNGVKKCPYKMRSLQDVLERTCDSHCNKVDDQREQYLQLRNPLP